MIRVKSSIFWVFVFGLYLSLFSCAGKARTLHLGVTQFKVESIAAVDAIDEMRKKEIAPEERNPVESTNSFVDNVLKSKRSAVGRVERWIDPFKPKPNPETEKEWAELIQNLKEQYLTFARIFDEIQRASFTGRAVVEESVPHIEKLVTQLAYFADAINQNPPQLLNRRSALIADLEKIRKTIGNTAAEDVPMETRNKIAEWREKWLMLMAAENELNRKTTEQCLKAVTIGLEVRKQMIAYNQVSLQDISEALSMAFSLAGAITGEDLSTLQARTEWVIEEINSDPVWSSATKQLVKEISGKINSRSKDTQPKAAAPGASEVTPTEEDNTAKGGNE
jgi:hypothetical protein